MKAVLSKRGWKAKLAAALAAATIAAPLGVAAIAPLVPAVQAYADEAQGQRVESGGGWYMNADGTYRYMNADGSYPSGWKEIDGYWYHFDAEGWAQTGWLWDADSWYYLNDYGRMIKGGNDWIDGELYYFFEDGRLAQSEAVSFIEVWATAGSEPGEYHNEIHYFCSYYGADGACVHGWAKIPEFTLHRQISDTPESWDDTPFQYRTSIVPGGWIYQDEFGSMCWYWRQIDGSWYYFQPYNYLGQWVENSSFNPEENRPVYSLMATGWCKPVGESSWYYLGTSGAMQTGWVNDGGTWYWLTSSGAMATGWQKIDGTWYYFNASGAMQAGWQKIDGSWYCFAASGAMLHDCWAGNYYLGSSGAMLTDARTPDGYYVGKDGAWVPGR